ncbi:MAG: metallophosphoesterase [Bacilli bacterium]|nr:metallophosphoesterase [Bacilli bacterium]MDD4643420.1 metallophosphoesterase [Bacilli bacterium]
MKRKYRLKKKYKIIIITLTILTLILLWSRYISTSGLIIKEYKVVNDNLPTSFDGLKIVHLSDIHYGRTIKQKELKHMVNEINEINPNLIFFTGDLIDRDIKLTPSIKKEVINTLKQLAPTIGKYAVAGNHDLAFKDFDNILTASGFINLTNDYDLIYSNKYETIYIAGLESEIVGKPNADKATQYLNNIQDKDETESYNNPSYKILLLHTPDTIKLVDKYDFNLVLAGHSHNGQIRLPIIGAITKPQGAKQFYNPYYKINNTDLYISGGLGTSTMNFRLFNKPSFNFYRLVKK